MSHVSEGFNQPASQFRVIESGPRAEIVAPGPADPCPRTWTPTPEFTRFDTMTTIADVEKLAFDLPETQRAILAAHLLESLPSVLQDDDDGIAEALTRDAALDQDPASGISREQLDEQVARRRA